MRPRGPGNEDATQQKPWRPCWCSRQKSVIKIILNWTINMAAVTSCANALLRPDEGTSKRRGFPCIFQVVKSLSISIYFEACITKTGQVVRYANVKKAMLWIELFYFMYLLVF